MSPCLDQDQISLFANTHELDVRVFDSIDSTNSWVLHQAITPGAGLLCVAEQQTKGRGRRGNQWQSAPGENIMMSLGWCFAAWPEAITGLSLTVGMVAAEHLNARYDLDVKVKWPNDLLVGEEKLAGILIELSGQPDGVCQVVIGLGLNVHQPDWSRDQKDYRWCDLNQFGIKVDRNELIGDIVRELVLALKGFEQNGFAPLVSTWPQLSSYQGRKINVFSDALEVTGEMAGVDEFGALLVVDEAGAEHRFIESNVSVRLVA